jgi:hypothetical protein
MKKISWILMVVLAFAVVGCEKKSASEQLADDVKKAADQMKKDLKNL